MQEALIGIAIRKLKTHLQLVVSNEFRIALTIAIVVRLLVFVATAFVPISADSGNLVSPSIAFGNDLPFYEERKNELISLTADDVLNEIYSVWSAKRGITAGPLFPMLLHCFSYSSESPLPLATVYLFTSIVLVGLWLTWLHREQVPLWGLIVFAVLPHPLYFMICISTELPFAVLFCLFFLYYQKEVWSTSDIVVWGMCLFLMLLTRPNALAVLMFTVIDLIVKFRAKIAGTAPYLLCLILMSGLFGLFFWPYFKLVYDLSLGYTFFDISAQEYLDGIFHCLPGWLDTILSVFALLIAKMLYLFGLRPSYSDVSYGYVMLRALPGVILLPGMIYLFFKGASRHKLLVIVFIIPILMVAAQDRYLLPIQPLLFYYGYRAFKSISALCMRGVTV